MTSAAFARPAAANNGPAFKVGQIVVCGDRYHTDRTGRRPHIVVGRRGDRYHVVELSHTPQGDWVTDELGGGTYMACIDFRTRRWAGRMVDASTVGSYRRQLSAGAREAALTEASSKFAAARR